MTSIRRLLLPIACLRLLDVGEVGIEVPPELELERLLREFTIDALNLECRDAHAIGELDVQARCGRPRSSLGSSSPDWPLPPPPYWATSGNV